MPTKESDKLLDFVANLAGQSILKVQEDLGEGFVVLNLSEAERRQAKHDIRCLEDIVVEMVRNSRDAGAKNVYIATVKDATGIRTVTVIDDGRGVPESFREKIFEPRVTSKVDRVIEDSYGVHGRGMALFSIKSNVDNISLVSSSVDRGSVFTLRANTALLPEKKDQSTLPKVKYAGGKYKIVSGPHNVWRHLFALNLESPQLNMFFGSQAEIIAALGEHAAISGKDGRGYIFNEIFSFKAPDAFGAAVERLLGIKLSLRQCQRLLAGEIRPARSIKRHLELAVGDGKAVRIKKNKAGGPVCQEDLDEFAQVVAEQFRHLAKKYFIKLSDRPKVVGSPTNIKVELSLEPDDSW